MGHNVETREHIIFPCGGNLRIPAALVLFSERLAWSTHDVGFLNDLPPLPYTTEPLGRVANHVEEVQMTLGRLTPLENPSAYRAFAESTYTESDFSRIGPVSTPVEWDAGLPDWAPLAAETARAGSIMLLSQPERDMRLRHIDHSIPASPTPQ